jgi:hypothetical protein
MLCYHSPRGYHEAALQLLPIPTRFSRRPHGRRFVSNVCKRHIPSLTCKGGVNRQQQNADGEECFSHVLSLRNSRRLHRPARWPMIRSGRRDVYGWTKARDVPGKARGQINYERLSATAPTVGPGSPTTSDNHRALGDETDHLAHGIQGRAQPKGE